MSTTGKSTDVTFEQPFGAGQIDTTKLADLPEEGRGKTRSMSAHIDAAEGQAKIARFRHFEIHCDEPHWLGGQDEHPQPLTYLVAGVGFCLLTQVRRYAGMRKVTITHADCDVEMLFYQDGSVLAGTLSSGIRGFRIHVNLTSPEPPERVAEVIDLAKRGCFAERLVETAVPIDHTFTLNGAAADF